MSDPRRALIAAVYGHLVSEEALIALLGGPAIFDQPGRAAKPPFVTIGTVRSRNADGDPAPVSDHRLDLEVVSRERGRSAISAIAEALAQSLHDTPLALDGHRLVQLRHEETRITASRDLRSFHAVVRLRAVTEPTA